MSHPNKIKTHPITYLSIGFIALLALVYALPSFSFLLNVEAGLSWIHYWYSSLVSSEFASSPTAYENAQRTYIHAMKPFMLLHVGGMATALGIGWIQFIPALRRAMPILHRLLGSVFLFAILLGGIGALGMVLGGETYGTANAQQRLTIEHGMMALVTMMWLSALVSMRWLISRDTRRHGDWMIMTYALVCTALPQRLSFLIYGWMGHDFETAFQLTSQFIVQPMLFIGLCVVGWRRFQHAAHTEKLAATSALWDRIQSIVSANTLRNVFTTVAVSLIAATVFNVLPFNDYPYHNGVRLNTLVVAIALLISAWALGKTTKLNLTENAGQWAIRGIVLALFPVIVVIVGAVLVLTGQASIDVAANTAPIFAAGAVLFLGDILISLLSWNKRLEVLGKKDERGFIAVMLRPLPGKANSLSDLLAITFGAAQIMLFAVLTVPAFALAGFIWLLDKVPGVHTLRMALYQPFSNLTEVLGQHLLADPRDMPVMHVIAKTVVTLVPLLTIQLWIGSFSIWLWAVYMLLMLGPGTFHYQHLFSASHIEGHRPKGYFNKKVPKPFDRAFENILGLLFGQLQAVVTQGHVRVHHVEDASYEDVQCVAHYNRSSIYDFAKFIGRENLLNNLGISLLDYFADHNRIASFKAVRTGVLIHLATILGVAIIDWKIAVAYLIIPKLMFNIVTGGATFAQHAFYKPDNINDVLACTTTFIFKNDFLNEGYHMSHHQRCAVHWSEMPAFFEANKPLYREHDSVVFKDLDTLAVFFLLILKRFDVLAKHVVDLQGNRSQDDIAAWLRARSAAVHGVQRMERVGRKMSIPVIQSSAV